MKTGRGGWSDSRDDDLERGVRRFSVVAQFKYSLFYGRPGKRMVGFDNERGKGDPMHVMGVEQPYRFTTIERLLEDFIYKAEDLRSVDE